MGFFSFPVADGARLEKKKREREASRGAESVLDRPHMLHGAPLQTHSDELACFALPLSVDENVLGLKTKSLKRWSQRFSFSRGYSDVLQMVEELARETD